MKNKFLGRIILLCFLIFECHGMDGGSWRKIGIRDIVNGFKHYDYPDLMTEIVKASKNGPSDPLYRTRLIFFKQDESFFTVEDVSCLDEYYDWERLYSECHDWENCKTCFERSKSSMIRKFLLRHNNYNIYRNIYCRNYLFIFFYDKVKVGEEEINQEILGILLGTTDEEKANHFRVESEFAALRAGQDITRCIGEKSFYIIKPDYERIFNGINYKDVLKTKYMKVVIEAEDLSMEEDGCLRVIAPDGFRKCSPIVPKRLFVECKDEDIFVGMAFPQERRYLKFVEKFLKEESKD